MLKYALWSILVAGTLGASVERRQISQGCERTCTANYDPVCASNHQTYSNRCVFGIAACFAHLKGSNLKIVHSGACGSDGGGYVDPVSTLTCDQICNEDISYICGSDGNIYQNTCQFKKAACEAALNNTRLVPISRGDSCPTPRAPDCQKYVLGLSDIALEGDGHMRLACPSGYHFVCGTSGLTYSNECHLCHDIQSGHAANEMILFDGQCTHIRLH